MASNLSSEIKEFCSVIGKDPFLVQAAGGNVSWKQDNILWIKASGTSLGEALNKEIFIPLDLNKMKTSLSNGEFNINEKALNGSILRPSIETALHALMNFRVVVHVHSISSLIHLVQEDSFNLIKERLGNTINWGYVKYFKPGAELAKAVSELVKDDNEMDVIFLENHGIVVGGDSLERAQELIRNLDNALGRKGFKDNTNTSEKVSVLENLIDDYKPSKDYRINDLARSKKMVQKLQSSWAMFPDHVVFLGPQAYILDITDLENIDIKGKNKPPFLFIKGLGVLQSNDLSKSQEEQLICYYNVLNNLDDSQTQRCLSNESISELLNWDAEVYRQALSKGQQSEVEN